MSFRRFAGQKALVTGGGRGLGKAVALALADEGAAVAVFSRTAGQLAGVVEELLGRGAQGLAVAGDAREEADVERAVAETLAAFGRLDVLVNCAGVFSMWPSTEGTLEEWRSIIDTNLTGTYLFCRAAGRAMLESGRGKIVNFASLLSFVAFPERAAYAASKGGVLQLTRVLGVEWIKRGVNVNAIAPGMISVETPHPLTAQDDSVRQRFQARVPMGRLGRPSDIAGPTLFLASAEADYVAGQTLVVDGGWLSYGYV
jgi:NAD(P)-dependent dehydrogenase (short-subunit alcohol dehydrogenase family)